MVTCTFLLGLPMLNSSVAFSAVTSIATIGLYLSYGKCVRPFSDTGHRMPFSWSCPAPDKAWVQEVARESSC